MSIVRSTLEPCTQELCICSLAVSVRTLEGILSHPLSDWTLPWQLINGKALRLNVCTDLLYCYGPNISGQVFKLFKLPGCHSYSLIKRIQKLHRLTSCLRFSVLRLGLCSPRPVFSLISGNILFSHDWSVFSLNPGSALFSHDRSRTSPFIFLMAPHAP